MRVSIAATLGMIALLAGPSLAEAQQPPAGERRAAPMRPPAAARQAMVQRQAGPSPEMILRMREELSLTEAQVARLETLRQEAVATRRERMGEALDLRSQLQAGRITREQLQERMRARMESRAEAPAPGERVRAVLTDQQRVRLAEMQVERLQRQVRMQGMRGRQGGMGGRGMMPGMRRGPGERPGMQGPQGRMPLEGGAMRPGMMRRGPAGQGGGEI